MKKTIIFLLVAFCMILLHSCSTSQKVTVQGVPGTEIYSPTMNKLGVIGSNAQVSFKISSDDYFSYLMSKNAGSNELVPFALDYKNHSYVGTHVLKWTGYWITGMGAVLAGAGGAACIGGDGDEVGGPLLAAGGGAALLGAAIGMPADARSNQTQYEHKYKYLSVQNTNQDFRFAKITDVGYRKSLHTDNNETGMQASNRLRVEGTSTTIAKRKAPASKRTQNDYAKLVSGTYSGSGYLAQKGKVIEEYSTMKVVVLRIDNSSVNIDVIENGESYFSTKTKYQVKKKGKNTYVLSLDGISDAFITIDSAGHLTYIHPKVNIDGEIYTLNITANKK